MCSVDLLLTVACRKRQQTSHCVNLLHCKSKRGRFVFGSETLHFFNKLSCIHDNSNGVATWPFSRHIFFSLDVLACMCVYVMFHMLIELIKFNSK